jgi:hypothetical protein
LVLWLTNPELSTRSCDNCKKWLYREDGTIAKRRGHKLRRPPGQKPPCRTCPKESPEKAWQYELHQRNWLALDVYWEVQATSGVCLTDVEKSDSILMRNLATIHRIMTEFRNRSLASQLTGLAISKHG